MTIDKTNQVIESVRARSVPTIGFIKRAKQCSQVGVFASSFNPVTATHIELMRRASEQFLLDEVLALAGLANADKYSYDCSLEDRLSMLDLATKDDQQISIGLTSHGYFTDMLEALEAAYSPETDLSFIVGFDTLVRLLDREGKYTAKYHRKFGDRLEALNHLISRSRFIVAGRAGASRQEVHALIKDEPARLAERTSFLDLPADFGQRSATEVRNRVGAGLTVTGLVVPAVEQYIKEHGLYRPSSAP
jgi:nicotinate-nucleotide adenylyltransferase